MHTPCDLIRCIFRLDLSSADAERPQAVVLQAIATANYYEYL
jgi:hypothetical protein